MPTIRHYQLAKNRYENSVMQARLSDFWGRMTGHATDLVRFQDVAQHIGVRQQIPRGIRSVPLDQIVGSVGRPHDFTRRFLPRPSVNAQRWSGIDAALNALVSLPPVDLFQIGEVYFVQDGHHRISVARANDLPDIEADVVEVQSPIRLTVRDFQRGGWLEKGVPTSKEEPMLELIELEVIKREQAERRRQVELERRLPRPQPTGLSLRLLERIGDRLIAFGTQLKATKQPVR